MNQLQICRQKYDSIYGHGFKWCSFCTEKKDAALPCCNVCGKRLRTKPRKSNKSVKYIE